MKKVTCLILSFCTVLLSGAQVNLPSGSAEFNLPVFSWQDTRSQLHTAIALAYSSGAGLRVNGLASNLGQGWDVLQGGVIVRMQAGEPDDQKPYDGNGTAEDLTKYPAGFLYDTVKTPGYSNHLTQYPLYKDKNHLYKQHNVVAADKEMDQFTFRINGKNGTFVLNKDPYSQECVFLGDTKYRGWYYLDESMEQQGVRTTITEFLIRDDRGLVYKFSRKELVQILRTGYTDKNEIALQTQPNFKDGRVYYEKSVAGSNSEIKNPYAVVAWYLDEISDPSSNRKIKFYYHQVDLQAEAGVSLSYYSKNYSMISHAISYSKTPRIDSIVFPDNYKVAFGYGADRLDLAGDKALSKISVLQNSKIKSEYRFKTTYVVKNRYAAAVSDFQKKWARLFLRSITIAGPQGREEDAPYRFDYYLGSDDPYDFVPPPFFHFKDIWGYYNGNNSAAASGAPIDPMKNVYDLSNSEIKGLCFLRNGMSTPVQNAKEGMARNGLLRQIIYPTGKSITYAYEQNKTTVGGQLKPTGGVHVSGTAIADGGYSNGCSNPIATTYRYVTEGGVQPSYWGGNVPVNSIIFQNYYEPEKKRFKLIGLKCDYTYKYPGIQAREDARALNSWQTALQIALNIAGTAGQIMDIINIVNFAATSTGPAAFAVAIVSTITNIVLSCFTTPTQDMSMTIYYNKDLNAANPLPAGFKRVEVVSGTAGQTGKTVYEFTNDADYPVWHTTNPTYSSKQLYAPWVYGLLKREAVYNNNGDILTETIHQYDTSHARRLILTCPGDPLAFHPICDIPLISYKNLIVKNSSQNSGDWDNPNIYKASAYTQDLYSNPDMKVDKYYFYTGRIELKKTIRKTFKKATGNQYQQTVTEYSYNNSDERCGYCFFDQNYEVNEIKTTFSNGDVYYQNLRYDAPILYGNSIFTVPFATTTSFQKSGTNTRYYTGEQITEYYYGPHGGIVPHKTRIQRFASPIPASEMHFYFDSGSPGSSDSYAGYITTGEMYYDDSGNLIGQRDEGGRFVKNIYAYDGQFITATAVGIRDEQQQIAYTSFETDSYSSSGWGISGVIQYGSLAVTGYRSAALSAGNTLSAQLNTTETYTLSFWTTGSLNVSGNAVLIKSTPGVDGFTYFEYQIPAGTGAVNITGTGMVDELRAYPAEARMVTTAYDPLFGKTAECDQNNRITYYNYDALGRLRFIKDDNRDVVKMYEYNQKSNENPCGVVFQNLTVREVFARNNCGPGYLGGNIEYTIPAGKYTSTRSQAEVDALVEKELAAAAQNYANANGVCQMIFVNDELGETFTKEGCDDGYKGTNVFYSVPAGKYQSLVSKADANEKAQEEIDANGQAFANAPGNASCIVDASPQFVGEEDAPTQCQKSGAQNTGNVLVLVTDVNPNSPTYNQTQWADMGENTAACPVDHCANCAGPANKCIDGFCQYGAKVYTNFRCISAIQPLKTQNPVTSGETSVQGRPLPIGFSYCQFTYHYEWSDGSWSQNYTEIGGVCNGNNDCEIPLDY